MSIRNKGRGKMEKIVHEAEFTPIVEQEQVQDTQNGAMIDLNDIAFMIMVGRKKDGSPFFHNVNVNDVFTVDGLIGYAKRKIDHTFKEHFDKEGVE